MDVFGSVAVTPAFSMTLGVRNLADTEAPFDYQTRLLQVGYDPRYSSVVGRAWFARGTYSF